MISHQLLDEIRGSCSPSLNFNIVTGSSTTISVSGVQLSSRYNPKEEACFQASNIPDRDTIYLYGVGLGYLPEELLKRESVKTLNVKIMNIRLFSLILGLRDQRCWLSDKRVNVSLASVDIDTQASHFVFPPDLLLADCEREKIKNMLSTQINSKFTKNQFKENDPILVKRIKDNYLYLKEDRDVDLLTDSAKGSEAIVIGSGPSLEQCIPKLQALYNSEKRPVLICVATASQLVVSAGIKPDYLVVIDKDTRLYHKLVCDFSVLNDSKLVYFPLVNPELLGAWHGDRYVAYSKAKIFNDVKQKFPNGLLFSGGSVIHVATDLAAKLGCSTITLCGADFSYSNHKTHAGQAHEVVDGYSDVAQPNESMRTVQNGYGENVQTLASFISYLVAMEEYIRFHTEIEFWNSSKVGAFIGGCKFRKDFI